MNPHLVGVSTQQQFISDLAREELLQSHCDTFRAALDLISTVALEVHTQPNLADKQRTLITIGTGGRASRALLEPYLKGHSATLAALPDPQEFWSALGCNCLTGQQTDAVHWLYNIVLGFDWEWGLGEQAIRVRLAL